MPRRMNNSMENDNLLLQVNRISDSLDKDFAGSYRELYTLVNNITDSTDLQLALLMLGSKLSDFLEEDGGIQLSHDHNKVLAQEGKLLLKTIVDSPHKPGANFQEVIDKFQSLSGYWLRDTPVLVANSITRKIGDFTIMPISFTLKLGEITSIVGKNGNGKSTLLKMVAGDIGVTGGELSFPLFSEGRYNWSKIKQQIAYIPQELPDWSLVGSIKNHLHFTASAKGLNPSANKNAVNYLINRLGLQKYQDYSWSNLSGGYKLRFELARQLVWSPKLLIMDEPLAHLDIKAQNLLLNDLRNLADSRRSPIAIILSSQNLYNVENITDQIIFLKNGISTYNGSISQINEISKSSNFLLEADCSIMALREALLAIAGDILEVRELNQEFFVTAKQNVTANQIVSKLILADIKIKHFRDITNSTRIFFEDDANY